MQTASATIDLSSPKSDTASQRLVKRAALSTFRTLRLMGHQAHKVPGVLAQAGADIQSAWKESAKHND